LDADAEDDVYEAEHRNIEDYQDKLRTAKGNVNRFLNSLVRAELCPIISSITTTKHRAYKLPTVEMRKFSGELKNWLGWWAQFEKIHLDEELHPTDKFQYLLQATVEGSRARRLVDGVPTDSYQQPQGDRSSSRSVW
jgi:hypothetical protein